MDNAAAVSDVKNAASLSDLLRERVRARPEQDAVVFVRDPVTRDDDPMSYAELDERARRIAGWLRDRVAVGDRVLLLHPSGVDFVAAFFGCLYAGAVAVPAPLPGRYHHERRRVKGIAKDAEVAAVLTDGANLKSIVDWVREGEVAVDEALVADSAAVGAAGALDGTGDPYRADRDALALLQYTSGSTGEPKGVELTHGNVLHNAGVYRDLLGVSGPVRFGGWAPLYHDMGLMMQTLTPLLLGGTCVLMTPSSFIRRPENWLRMVDDYDLVCSQAPNFAYALCTRKVTDEQLAGLDLSRWRYAVCGAEPVQASTMREFKARFAAAGLRDDALFPGYGLAEATVAVSGAPWREDAVLRADPAALERGELRPAEASGRARELPGNGWPRDFDVRVVDPDTGEVRPDGQVGEVWLRGPSVSRGYWRNEVATAATFGARTADGDGGYLRTGDLGALVGGELYVTGRRKDLMIIRGRNLHPSDVEHELRTRHEELDGLPGAAFTVPVADEEALVVVQEVRGRRTDDEARALVRAMRLTVAREFGVHAAGVLLVQRGAVRRTTSGKVQRAAMRQLFLAGELEALFADCDGDLTGGA